MLTFFVHIAICVVLYFCPPLGFLLLFLVDS